ncbi:MAG TPA: anti-sigma regulatory factor [Phycisphaerales bacterium]|nr:anti-sigma regulatory factor [Phycisphaerales bacterium]
MDVGKGEVLSVRTPDEVVLIRQAVRKWAIEVGFSIVDQTKVVTAASELARNAVIYAGGGTVTINLVTNAGRKGLRLIFADKGPGIPDISLALKDGYTTGNGLGLGLSGSKRLMNELDIVSKVGEGTTITAFKWK